MLYDDLTKRGMHLQRGVTWNLQIDDNYGSKYGSASSRIYFQIPAPWFFGGFHFSKKDSLLSWP